MGGRGPNLTAGWMGRAPDKASVVFHMSYLHEMSVCQICFLLVASGKLSLQVYVEVYICVSIKVHDKVYI